mgnify:CR=1 FL=1
MYKVDIYVTLKKDVLDPQGKAIKQAAERVNVENIIDVKQGKYFEVFINNLKSVKDAKTTGSLLSEKLLCNEVIEDYKIISVIKI